MYFITSRSSTRSGGAASSGGNHSLCRRLFAGLHSRWLRGARFVGARVRPGLPRRVAMPALRVCTRWFRRDGGVPGIYTYYVRMY